jgi:preprotein translocase subunit SecD
VAGLAVAGVALVALVVTAVVLRSRTGPDPVADGWAFEIRPVLASGAPGMTLPAASPAAAPTDPSDPAWISPQVAAQLTALDCTSTTAPAASVAGQPLVACAQNGSQVYVLGPAEVTGAAIAAVGTDESSSGTAVAVTLDRAGDAALLAMTTRLGSLQPPRNQLALVLDGRVLTAPTVVTPLTGGPIPVGTDLSRAEAAALDARLTARHR